MYSKAGDSGLTTVRTNGEAAKENLVNHIKNKSFALLPEIDDRHPHFRLAHAIKQGISYAMTKQNETKGRFIPKLS